MNRSAEKLLRQVVCAMLFLVLGFLALQAANEGLANLYAQSAQQEIERRPATGLPFPEEKWTRAMQYLAASLRYSPRNPWPLELMGTLQSHRMHAATDPETATAATRSSNAYLRMALVERPTSPYTWASLALSKLHLNELDDELFGALRHADELGPWEPEVQKLVLFVGLAVWHRLDTVQRAAMIQTLERAALRNATEVTELVRSFNRFDLLCDINNDKLKVAEHCGRLRNSEASPDRP